VWLTRPYKAAEMKRFSDRSIYSTTGINMKGKTELLLVFNLLWLIGLAQGMQSYS